VLSFNSTQKYRKGRQFIRKFSSKGSGKSKTLLTFRNANHSTEKILETPDPGEESNGTQILGDKFPKFWHSSQLRSSPFPVTVRNAVPFKLPMESLEWKAP